MAYTNVCKQKYVAEGEWMPATLDGDPIMLVWPDGDRLRAFQGLCPHEHATLNTGVFNGRIITCTAHGWVFDARTGKGLRPAGWHLAEYPVRIDDGWIQVDLAGAGT